MNHQRHIGILLFIKLAIVFILNGTLHAQAPLSSEPSARLPKGVSAEEWISRQKANSRSKNLKKQTQSVSVMDTLEPYTPVDPSGSENIEDIDQATLQKYFALVRDTRFLKEPNNPQFLRRISWLYPLDGCFARASMARELMLANNGPLMKKIFVVGRLAFSWWYHVALITKVNGQLYVIDPALQAKAPLPLDAWMKLSHASASDRYSSEVAICSPYTYTPDDNCFKTTTLDMQRVSTVYAHQYSYLRKEWSWLKANGKNPEKLLGSEPPWSFLNIITPTLTPLKL